MVKHCFLATLVTNMEGTILLDQKQHLTAPGTPESMSNSEIDESKSGILEIYGKDIFIY